MGKEPKISDKESKLFDMIFALIAKIFEMFGVSSKEKKLSGFIDISEVPKKGDRSESVKILKEALNKHGAGLDPKNNYFGDITLKELSAFQKRKGLKGTGVIPSDGGKTFEFLGLRLVKKEEPKKDKDKKSSAPWFWEAKKHEGKHESNPSFQAYMNQFWAKSGLPSFKGLVGSARAWCGIFALSGLLVLGYVGPEKAFRAISWDNQPKINWRVNGFPQGAFIRINSRGNCTSRSGNHITMANGDCAAKDLLKKGATFSGYGGNQGNRAKVSTYSVSKICSVTWPKGEKLPGKVIKSVNCSNGKTSNESTR